MIKRVALIVTGIALIAGISPKLHSWHGVALAASQGYTVSGNVIEDPRGSTFTPHGVARPSLEWGCNGTGINGSTGIPASDFSTMRDAWHANTVRLALNQDFWLTGAARYCSNYKTVVNSAVTAARQAGLVVILDLHWSDQGNLANTSPGQQCMADQNSVTFWQQVATTYKGDSGVWFELYNEPHDVSWSIWQNGGSVCGFEAAGMQSLYNAVRGTGASNIVVATGNGWGAHLDGVPLLTGTNIAYAIHPYANQSDPTAWSNSDWENRFGYLTSQVPVIATEFGKFQCGVDSYDQGILDFFRSKNMGYTAWAWYNGGCSFPSLISDAQGDCVNGGCVTQQDLLSFPKVTQPDVNGDGVVNSIDISMVVNDFGKTKAQAANSGSDVDFNGVVNGIDLSTVVNMYGK